MTTLHNDEISPKRLLVGIKAEMKKHPNLSFEEAADIAIKNLETPRLIGFGDYYHDDAKDTKIVCPRLPLYDIVKIVSLYEDL